MGLILAVLIVMSVAVVGFSAAQVEITTQAAKAEDIASMGAESDAASQGAEKDVAPTGAGTISFDAASAGWESASAILFYIHEIGGDELAAWGSKKNLGGTKGDNNIWSFDAEKLGVQSGKYYGIIFNNADTNAETYDLLLTTDCYGDTAKADPGTMIENPVDSNKKSMKATWTNTTSCGPILQITSIGTLVGETVPGNTTKYQMFVNFLASKDKDGLQNALNFNGKDAQTTIDDTAKALGLSKSEVKKAIEEAATTGNSNNGDKNDWSDKWDASKSSLPEGSSSGSGSSSSSTSGSSTSGSSTSGSSTSGGSSSSSSTTKSGSASNTQTGQEETVLFIMLGVMVAAAGVIFFVRKRERA